MRAHKIDLLIGLIAGLSLFFAPILSGSGEIIGSDSLLRWFPALRDNIVFLVIPYLIFFSLVFLVYFLPTRNRWIATTFWGAYLAFIVGVLVSFIAFLLIGIWAISQLGF